MTWAGTSDTKGKGPHMGWSSWVTATAHILLVVGCGSAEPGEVSTEPASPTALECESDLRESGELDYGDEPAPDGEPVEIVRDTMGDREVELREVAHDEPGAYRVAVERDGRIVALVEVRDWAAGGRVVSSFEACPGFTPLRGN